MNDGTYTSVNVDGTNYSLTTSTNIKSQIKYVYIKGSDFAGIINVTVGIKVITLEMQTECKYTPIDVKFLNKYGAYEIMSFFKANKENTSISRESFTNNIVVGGNYDVSRHQYQVLTANAKDSITINSGFVPEAYNETVKQLLLSTSVFILKDGVHIPVNVSNGSYAFKTRINDKLINHSLTLDYAFDTINNI